MTLGVKIKELREGMGYSRQDLAKRAQVERSYLSKLERDITKRPGADILVRLAKALHVDADVLFAAAGYSRTLTEEEIVRREAESEFTRLAHQMDRELTGEEKESVIEFMLFVRARKRDRERHPLDPHDNHPTISY